MIAIPDFIFQASQFIMQLGIVRSMQVMTDKTLVVFQLQNAVRAICMEVESLVKKCGKPKMLDAIRLPPPELYRHVEVCFDVLV